MTSASGPIEAAQFLDVIPGAATEMVSRCCEMAPAKKWADMTDDDMTDDRVSSKVKLVNRRLTEDEVEGGRLTKDEAEKSAASCCPGPRTYLTSLKSEVHNNNQCKPCFFLTSRIGCKNGQFCEFCHFAHSRRSSTRLSKPKRHRFQKLLNSSEKEGAFFAKVDAV